MHARIQGPHLWAQARHLPPEETQRRRPASPLLSPSRSQSYMSTERSRADLGCDQATGMATPVTSNAYSENSSKQWGYGVFIRQYDGQQCYEDETPHVWHAAKARKDQDARMKCKTISTYVSVKKSNMIDRKRNKFAQKKQADGYATTR